MLIFVLTPRYEKMTRHRMLPFERRLYFSEKKYSYLDVAPEPLAFRNEMLEGLLKLNFGRLVSGVSF